MLELLAPAGNMDKLKTAFYFILVQMLAILQAQNLVCVPMQVILLMKV